MQNRRNVISFLYDAVQDASSGRSFVPALALLAGASRRPRRARRRFRYARLRRDLTRRCSVEIGAKVGVGTYVLDLFVHCSWCTKPADCLPFLFGSGAIGLIIAVREDKELNKQYLCTRLFNRGDKVQ